MKRLSILIFLACSTASGAATITSLAYVNSSAGVCESQSFSDGPGGADDFGSFSDFCATSGTLGADIEPFATVDYAGAAAARASFGSLGVLVGASTITQPSTRVGVNVTSSAYSFFQDVIYSSLEVGSIVIPLDLMGTVSATNATPNEIASYASASFAAEVASGNLKYIYGVSFGQTFGGFQENGTKGVTDFIIPILGGQSALSARLDATAFCNSGNFSQDGLSSTVCNAGADFYSSLRFLGAKVYDAEGLLVSNATLRSDSGFDYIRGVEPHITISPVPLPASGTLLLIAVLGLVGLGFGRNRQTPRYDAHVG